ncbi:unnamed protein product [Prunus brigantina]
MDICCWNVRGAASSKFKSNVLDLIRTHHLDMLFLCEPRISGAKAISVVKTLGFPCFEVVDAVGFSGVLWLLWDDSRVHVEVVGTSDQTISACVARNGQDPWLFTGVYASPNAVKRGKMWDYLSFVAASHNMPWLIAGDFNELLTADEKFGGVLECKSKGFKNWVDDNEMIDLGYSGPKFTWNNKRVYARLDRAICNMRWRRLFPEANVQHLPRTTSDHNPIKIKLSSHFVASPHLRPFRFEAMWMQHEHFHEFISDVWGQAAGSALDKTYQLVQPLKDWNVNVFGHLKKRKACLLARLNGIQKALCRGLNIFLSKLEISLIEEYNCVLEHEAMLWKQKSRLQWLQEGDRNTKFFHLTTIIRRRRNKIERLKNNEGVWVEEAQDIKGLAMAYFEQLFSQEIVEHRDLTLPKLFPVIDSADLELLEKDIDMVEIKRSLFGIGGLKAPGVDGFPACFYQAQWNKCADDIFALVTQAFQKSSIPDKLNYTLITLVPKVQSPQTMVQFRPISLCSTLYKVISKILVARLRPILPDLISPNQVSFIPGRHITDNILIAQELMHKFKLSKGKKGFVAWKIDLSKAYDRLSWHFVEYVLLELRLPAPFVKLIMNCVQSVRYQINVNGALTTPFSPMNGIRQGDPLSPYLFVLCIEKLSHIICDAVSKKKWRPVKSSQSGPAISHLFFADDLVLFAEASASQAKIMKSCLDLFCSASGQVVNFEKSAVFCSPNTCKEVAKEISLICGSPLTNDLGKYLGMPILHSRIGKRTYSPLVDKVHKRLAAWKSKLLSLAGRATLIQAVTASIPVYAMQTTKLPVSVCNDLDRLNRNFFWGSSEKKYKIHLCQWDLACRPKSKGGLGFKKTASMNQALLAKIGWRLHTKDNGLWAKIYEAKYLKGASIFDKSLGARQVCSTTWRSIIHGIQLLMQGMCWRIGQGDSVKFWEDNWVTDAPLMQQAGALTIPDSNCPVSSFSKNGWWDIDKLRGVLCEDLVQQVISVPVGFLGSLPDTQIWKGSANGDFSVKSAYSLFFGGCSTPDSCWKSLWSLNVPPKLQYFMWLASQGKILSNDQRVRRQLAFGPSCGFCSWPTETVLHILRDCERARSTWNAILPACAHHFFHLDAQPWMKVNMLSRENWNGDVPWSTVFVFTCWHLWCWRNKHVFQNEDTCLFSPRQVICGAAQEWIKSTTNLTVRVNKVQIHVAWEPPGPGQFKLNVDGPRRSVTGCIGAGGVIRDPFGGWVSGFAVNLGKGQVLEAEIWGLFFGLKLAIEKGISSLIIEMDSAIAVNLCQNSSMLSLHPYAAGSQVCSAACFS